MWQVMIDNLSGDFYIIIAAFIELVIWLITLILAIFIKSMKSDTKYEISVADKFFSVAYSLFYNSISIFPLLGMFGTVKSLLGFAKDMHLGDSSLIQNHFFEALTSTAWGIIFAIFFKIMYSLFAPFFDSCDKVNHINTNPNGDIE